MPCSRNTVLAIIDTGLCLFVFFPLSVLHWRGTWDLLDVYIYPKDILRSSWVTLIMGSVGCFMGYVLQPQLARYVLSRGGGRHRRPATDPGGWEDDESEAGGRCCCGGRRASGRGKTKASVVLQVVISRLYMYVFGWAVLCYWRGVWNLMDLYLSSAVPNSLLFYGLGVSLAALFRSLRTITGVPMQVQVDTDPDLMREPDTRFKTRPNEVGLFLLDVCFSQFVLVTLSIFVWRGIWNVLDAFLFPGDQLLSDLASLVGGYCVILILFLLEYPASAASSVLDRRSLSLKILFEDMVMLVATWGVLMVWRGAWDLLHAFFLPDELVGGWVSHTIGVVGLLLCQGFGNVGVNGIDVDGSYKGGAGIFQTHFLREVLAPQSSSDSMGVRKKKMMKSLGDQEDKTHLLAEEEEDTEGEEEDSEEEREIIYDKNLPAQGDQGSGQSWVRNVEEIETDDMAAQPV